jgi:hypothetical protein
LQLAHALERVARGCDTSFISLDSAKISGELSEILNPLLMVFASQGDLTIAGTTCESDVLFEEAKYFPQRIRMIRSWCVGIKESFDPFEPFHGIVSVVFNKSKRLKAML